MSTSSPSKFRICRTLSHCTVPFPRSRSPMKRLPVWPRPARSTCVNPCALRRSATSLPKSAVEFTFPLGAFSLNKAISQAISSRSGSLSWIRWGFTSFIPERDDWASCPAPDIAPTAPSPARNSATPALRRALRRCNTEDRGCRAPATAPRRPWRSVGAGRRVASRTPSAIARRRAAPT